MQQIERDCFSVTNVGPYIYDVSISGFTRSSIYVYDISSLKVNTAAELPRLRTTDAECRPLNGNRREVYLFFVFVYWQAFFHVCVRGFTTRRAPSTAHNKTANGDKKEQISKTPELI